MAERREYRTTVIQGSDRRVYVPVLFDPDEVWGKKRRHAITGSVNGMGVRGDVQQVDGGCAFVLGPAWRRDCGISPGDLVDVVLTAEGPQRDDLAEDVAAALAADPAAGELFDSLAQFYRNAYLRWIDAALGAVDHLCGADATDLAEPTQLRAALLAYNRSDKYVTEVVRWITLYDRTGSGSLAEPATPTGVIVSVQGIRVDQSIAPGLEELLAAADAAGLDLTGSGWRSAAQQITLREAHCGGSHYAIYEMPASQCRPPTAPPGSSKHERGLAVDFTQDGAVIQRGTRADAWLMANAP